MFANFGPWGRRAQSWSLILATLAAQVACSGISDRLAHPTMASRGPVGGAAMSAPGPVARDSEDPPTSLVKRVDRPTRVHVDLPFGGWITVTGKHLALHTDANSINARGTTNHFETLHAGLAHWFGLDPDGLDSAGAIEVVLFANPVDYDEALGADRGIFVSGGRLAGLLVAPFDRDQAELDELLARGFAYQLIRAKYPHLPSWLEDGIAIYVGTIKTRDRELWFGGPARGVGIYEDSGYVIPLDELFAAGDLANPDPPSKSAAATSAFALVNYLQADATGGPQAHARFDAWLALVNATHGKADEIRGAFAGAYPEKLTSEIDPVLSGRARRSEALPPRPFGGGPAPAGADPLDVAKASPTHIDDLLSIAQKSTPHGQQHREQMLAWRDWAATTRRNQLHIDGSAMPPGRLFALTYGRALSRHHGVDLQLGLAPVGTSMSIRYRFESTFGVDDQVFVALAVGPWLALSSWTDNRGDEVSTQFLALAPELAAGFNLAAGLQLRASAGVLFKTYSTPDCGFASGLIDYCNSEAGRLVKEAVIPVVSVGAGYIW
jgi:hypothetical protein